MKNVLYACVCARAPGAGLIIGRPCPRISLCCADAAVAINDKGNIERTLNLTSAASESYRRALGIRQRCLPPDHPDLAESLGNLGLLKLEAEEAYEDALELFERQLHILNLSVGASHPDTVQCRNQTGVRLACPPLLAQSITLEALVFCYLSLPALCVLLSWQDALMKLERWSLALAHKEAAYTGLVELHGPTSSELADVLSDLSVCVAPRVCILEFVLFCGRLAVSQYIFLFIH